MMLRGEKILQEVFLGLSLDVTWKVIWNFLFGMGSGKNVILKLGTLKFMMPLRDIELTYCLPLESWFKFLECLPELINIGFRVQDVLANGVQQFFWKLPFLGLAKLVIHIEKLGV